MQKTTIIAAIADVICAGNCRGRGRRCRSPTPTNG